MKEDSGRVYLKMVMAKHGAKDLEEEGHHQCPRNTDDEEQPDFRLSCIVQFLPETTTQKGEVRKEREHKEYHGLKTRRTAKGWYRSGDSTYKLRP